MKSFDLNAYGVSEMSQVEMISIDGGSWLSDAWSAVKSAATAVAETVSTAAEAVGAAAEAAWEWACDHGLSGGRTGVGINI